MRGTDKQIAWATEIKTAFMTTLNAMVNGNLDADTPQAKLLRDAIARVDAAPASWWINVVTNGGTNQSDVAQVLSAVAQNKEWAISGLN